METKILSQPARPALERLLAVERVVAIVDRRVAELHPFLLKGVEVLTITAAEAQKSLRTASRLYRELMRLGADRGTFVVGIGGGITTDLAGFVAATYMRGVRLGLVPTTLLAQVDAALGGKNGVNVDHYKNMAGTFYPPVWVVSDAALLGTLPDREFRAGLAEAVKSAVIGDLSLFELLENATYKQLRTDGGLLRTVIERASAVKMGIVERDPRESGERRLLNLGHTLGHALEHCAPDLNHGEAVSIGVARMASAAASHGLLDAVSSERIVALLRALGLPISALVPAPRLVRAALRDKKIYDGEVRLAVPVQIGRCEVRAVPVRELKEWIG